MNPNESYIKTYVREANLRLYYIIFSWLLCLCTCYLKSSQIIYLIIKPTLQKVDNGLKNKWQSHGTSPAMAHDSSETQSLRPDDKSIILSQPQTEINLKNLEQNTNFVYQPAHPSKITENTPQSSCLSEICELSCLDSDISTYNFIYTNVSEAFYATLEAVITFSIAFTLPVFVYHLWCFLMPSRYSRERMFFNKRSLQCFVYILFFLWLIIYVLLPDICQFLHLFAVNSGKLQITNQARIAPYLTWVRSTVLRLLLASSTPLWIYLCLKYRIFKLSFLIKNRRIVTYLLITLAAILSPPDLWSQLSLSFCLFVFFECVIWVYLYKIKNESSHDN